MSRAGPAQAGAPVEREAGGGARVRAWISDLFSPLLAGFVLLLAIAREDTYLDLMQEDGWAEWSTFLAFAIAGALALRGLFERQRARLDRLALLGLALFSVFVAGEEISWGQRLLGFVPPKLFLERNYQQETNLHNLLKDVFDTRWQVMSIALAYGVAAPLAARFRWIPLVFSPSWTLSPGFLAVAAIELSYPFDLSGELAELALGLLFVSDATHRVLGAAAAAHGKAARTALLLQAGGLAFAAILGPTLDVALHRTDPERSREAEAEIHLLERDVLSNGILAPRVFKKRRVHKRVFTAVRQRYLKPGRSSEFLERRPTVAQREETGTRADRRGYFLDPWNQPYWMLFERIDRRSGRLAIYSFGPNRRRDGEVRSLASTSTSSGPRFSGDDLGVVFDVGRSDETPGMAPDPTGAPRP